MPVSNVTLYTVWTLNNYSVTYSTLTSAGGATTSGSAPVDPNSPYPAGYPATVLGNTGSFTLSGYAFLGWCTTDNAADPTGCTGSVYKPADIFTPASNVTLYSVWVGPAYTVTYSSLTSAGGATTSGSAPVDPNSPYLPGNDENVLGNTGSLTLSGYAFLGWCTTDNAADPTGCTGDQYPPVTGLLYMPNHDVTFYSVWLPPQPLIYTTFTSTGDQTSSGSAPVDPNSPYLWHSTVTVLGNTGSLTLSGSSFAGWCETDDAGNPFYCDGTLYPPGSTFSMPAHGVELNSVWTPGKFPLSYSSLTSAGGATTSGSAPVDPNTPYTDGTTVTVLGNTGSLTLSGYTFAGWCTADNAADPTQCKGTKFSAAGTFSMVPTNVTFYSVWTANLYTVTYSTLTSAGGATTSGSAPFDPNSPYRAGYPATVLDNTHSFTLSGYAFLGWCTTDNAADPTGCTGIHYDPGQTFSLPDNDVVLYSEWTSKSYAITYSTLTSAGGATTSGSAPIDPNSPYLVGTLVSALDNTGSLTLSGYTFVGWCTTDNASDPTGCSGTEYASADLFYPASDVTLYSVWTANTHTVTYSTLTSAGGATTSGSAPVDPNSPYVNGASATVLGSSGSLTLMGYSFAGWWCSTPNAPNPTECYGDEYGPTDPFTPTSDVTLYSIWVGPPRTVTYSTLTSAGGATTSGSAPADLNSPYPAGDPATVVDYLGFTLSGYTFAGWCTTDDAANPTECSGTEYSPFDLFTPTSDVTLYSVWTANTYAVTYSTLTSAGGATTSGSAPIDPNSPYSAGSTVTIFDNTGSLTLSGYSFAGWCTTDNASDPTGCSGTEYASADFFTPTSDVTLYSVWTANTHTVTYSTLTSAGGATTSGSAPVDPNSPYSAGSTVTIFDNTGSLTLSGYSFAGWCTTDNAALPTACSGTKYGAAGTFPMPASNVTLYSVWTANTYTVTYSILTSAGGATTSGSAPVDPNSPYSAGSTVTIFDNTGSLTLSGYSFAGWCTTDNAALPTACSGTEYASADFFTPTSDVTLYSVWTANTHTVTYSTLTSAGGATTSGSAPVDPNSPYVGGASATVLGNLGSLTLSGYSFADWCTTDNAA
ncbi:MAG TPA: InlB B-repeat-containing protein, partial [Acidimicrobiales bacterium]